MSYHPVSFRFIIIFIEVGYTLFMKEIPVTRKDQTYYALVDDEDYERLTQYSWTLHVHGYAHGWVPDPRINGKRSKQMMHRFILGVWGKEEGIVDHFNKDKLDNRKSNLSLGTASDNQANRKITTNLEDTDCYVGVREKEGLWRAYCYHCQDVLGYYEGELEAAKNLQYHRVNNDGLANNWEAIQFVEGWVPTQPKQKSLPKKARTKTKPSYIRRLENLWCVYQRNGNLLGRFSCQGEAYLALHLWVNEGRNLYKERKAEWGRAAKEMDRKLRQLQKPSQVIRPKAPGVTWNRERGLWRSTVGLKKKKVTIGFYPSFEEAVQARVDFQTRREKAKREAAQAKRAERENARLEKKAAKAAKRAEVAAKRVEVAMRVREGLLGKTCKRCKVTYLPAQGSFSVDNGQLDGFCTYCIKCISGEQAHQDAQLRAKTPPGKRVCKVCSQELPLTELYFYPKVDGRDGFRPQCIPCYKARQGST